MATSVKDVDKKGFTIIEVMLVLAVSGLLLLIAFLGQGATTQRARFTDSVENLKSQMETLRNSVNNTVIEESEGCNSALPATTAKCIKFGKAVSFANNSDNFTVQTIVADGPDADGVEISPNIRVIAPKLFGLPQKFTTRWGLTPSLDGGNIPKIAFIRHAGTGKLETHIISDGISLENANSYDAPGTKFVLPLISPDGYKAEIIFNEPANTINIRFK